MGNFRIDKLLVIDNEVSINRNDTIKLTMNTGEIIQGAYMQIKLHLYTEIEIFRRGIVWVFDIADIEKIEKVE